MMKVFISTLIFIHVCQGGSFIPGTVIVPLKDCSEGMVSDGKGGCIYTTTMLPETTMTKTTYHYDDECNKVFGHRFRRCEGTTSTPTTTEIITSTISFTYTCPWYSISDGNGGCYVTDSCGGYYVYGRRFRRCEKTITIMTTTETITTTTTEPITTTTTEPIKTTTTENSITPSTLAIGSLDNNQQNTDSREIAVTTTNFPSPYTTACTGGSISDAFGGCIIFNTCEMIYGPCDCNGSSECCTHGECFIPCDPDSSASRNRRCSPPETTVPTIPPAPTTLAHNKCVKK